MRDKNLNATWFCDLLEDKVGLWAKKESQLLRSNVVDSSNHEGGLTFFRLTNLKLRDQIKLSIVSWYLPEEVGFVLREDLREVKKYLDLDDQCIIDIMLESRGHMELFLLETQLWHSRDFFGNILVNLEDLNRFLRVRRVSKKVTRTQRKRGYHDHGSRVCDSKWTPKYDYTLKEIQNEIERRRESFIDTKLFIEGWIT